VATTLWPDGQGQQSDTMPNLSAYLERRLGTSVEPTLSSNLSCATTAGGNHIELKQVGTAVIHLYRINAVTISGTVSFSANANEDAMATNARMGCRVVRIADGTTTIASDVVDNTNAGHPDDVELGTASADMTWTATPTSTAFSAGDWLGVIFHADNIGTMAVGTVSLNVGANVNTFVTFTEAITAFSGAAVASLVIPHRHRGLIVR